MRNRYKHLFLLGRPASGKSEFIDYLKSVEETERANKYHIGRFDEIDDFLWLWEKFIEDDIWESAGYPRRYSKEYMPNNSGMTPEGAPLLDFCIEKFNRDISKNYLSNPEYYNNNTLIIEFARGGTKGYNHCLNRIAPELWKDAAIIYIDVTAEDSWRRNVARYEEKQRHSILAHMVPKETYDFHFRTHDWYDVTEKKESGFVTVSGVRVPYITMNNEPELPPGPEIGERYRKALETLWGLYTG